MEADVGGDGWVGLKETMSIVLKRCHSSHVNTIESRAAAWAVIANTSVSEKQLLFPRHGRLSVSHLHMCIRQK